MKALKKIPKSFKLRGDTINVKISKRIESAEALGLAKLLQKSILIQTTYEGEPIAEDAQRDTFWHEVAHHILYSMDESDLCNNEKFVNQLGITIKEVVESLTFK